MVEVAKINTGDEVDVLVNNRVVRCWFLKLCSDGRVIVLERQGNSFFCSAKDIYQVYKDNDRGLFKNLLWKVFGFVFLVFTIVVLFILLFM